MHNQIVGVWHRPNSNEKETSLEGLCAVLDEFQNSGINLVFLETFYHGMSILKSNLVPYSDELKDYSYGEYPDYLRAFVGEAKKRGIEVHAWVQDFYVGVEDDAELVKAHSDWLLINQSGGFRHTTEGQGFGGYLFFDPSNPAVTDYLTSVYDEILTVVPDIMGLNMDYIRYPVSVFEEDTDTGYTEICMNGFAERAGITFVSDNKREELNRIIKEKGLFEEWVSYRSEFVTGFVKRIHDMIAEKHSGKKISTAVFPEISQSYYFKKQNIKMWLDNHYIDMATPMVYFFEASKVHDAVKNLKSMCGDIKCYTGLYTTYHKQTPKELADHIRASRDGGADGFVLFDSAKTFCEATEDYRGFLAENYGRK